MTTQRGKLVSLYGPTGSGKTSQIAMLAQHLMETTGKRTILCPVDEGGYDAIHPDLIANGTITIEERMDEDNPWIWLQERFTRTLPDDVGLIALDSGTGIADQLLLDASDLASKGVQVGQEKVFKLKIPETDITIGGNNKSQYGLIQNFILRQIGLSSRLTRSGIHVLWTFLEHYPEPGDQPVIGPKVAGKALTPRLPARMRYTLRIDRVAQVGAPPRHLLYTAPQVLEDGLTTFMANSRAPLGVEIPAVIEPASLPEFFSYLPT